MQVRYSDQSFRETYDASCAMGHVGSRWIVRPFEPFEIVVRTIGNGLTDRPRGLAAFREERMAKTERFFERFDSDVT